MKITKEVLRKIICKDKTIGETPNTKEFELVLDELETYINKVREEAEQKGYFAGLQVNQMKDWIVKSSDKTEPLQPIKEQPKSLDQKADEEMEMNRR